MPLIFSLNHLDIFIIVFLFVLMPFLALKAKVKNSWLDYILMGRKVTLPLFVCTMSSSWYGNVLTASQLAYEYGVYNILIAGFWYLAYIIYMMYILPKLTSGNYISILDILKANTGKYNVAYVVSYVLVKSLPVSYATSLGIILGACFGFPFEYSVIFVTLFCAVYSMKGFKSVVISDVLHFFLMFSAVLIVLWFSYLKYGGLDFLTAQLLKKKLTLLGENSMMETVSWSFIAIISTFASPLFAQMCLAAKDLKTARMGICCSMVLWFIFDIAITLGAMYASVVFPGDKVFGYLRYGNMILGSGFKGIFIAGILSTVLSTLDSYLFIFSTTLSYDLKYMNRKRAIIISSLVTIGVSLLFNGDMSKYYFSFKSHFIALFTIPVLTCFFVKVKDSKAYIVLSLIVLVTVLIKEWFGLGNNVNNMFISLGITILFLSLRCFFVFIRKHEV